MASFNFNAIWQFIVVLGILVVVHEYGHFAAARAFGVKVYEFSVGFGPLIGKFNRKGVQYSFRWVLLGGFCKIAGMDMALEGKESEESPLKPGESFLDLSLWKRIVVIAAGPFFNLFLAMILIFGTFTLVGQPTFLSNPAPIIEQAMPGSPAFEAGFQPGDKILSMNNLPVKQWVDIPRIMKQNDGKPVTIRFERKGQTLVKKVKPMYNPMEKRYVLGINGITGYKKVPVLEAAKMSVVYPWLFIRDTAKGLVMMIRGQVKGGGMGPIGMVAAIEQNTKLPVYYTLFFMIIISISLFFFNLLPVPLPLLDGGWIVIMIIERLLRREFSAEQKAVAQLVGLTLIAFLFIVITYGDILTTFRRFFGG
jgi:regulator of sigma E protease